MYQSIHVQLHRFEPAEQRRVESTAFPPSEEGGGFDRVRITSSVVLGRACVSAEFSLLVPLGRGEALAAAIREAIEP